VNSVGELPLDYLSCGLEEKSKIVFANALEIAEQYRVKERIFSYLTRLKVGSKSAREIAFKPFQPLRSEGNHMEDRISKIEVLIDRWRYEEAIEASTELMTLALGGLRYLQT